MKHSQKLDKRIPLINMEEKHTITAKDKFVLTVVLLVIFVGVFGLGIIGVLYSLLS